MTTAEGVGCVSQAKPMDLPHGWSDLDQAYLDIFGEHPELVADVIDLASVRAAGS